MIFGIAITAAAILFRYQQIAKVLKWLALILFTYVITAFLTKPDWKAVFHATFLPKWTGEHSAGVRVTASSKRGSRTQPPKDWDDSLCRKEDQFPVEKS